LANAKAATTVKFNGQQTFPYRRADPGRIEEDDFYINDVALSIPPEDIHVEKRAFNHEWQTLRTPIARKAKSGHSTARVSFDIIFKVSHQDTMLSLINLVAGLRAAPFCVIHSLYLERVLGIPDASGPIASNVKPTNRTIQFRPIMLALVNMTFSTLGHENKPDCIRGSFDFMWFNYLPLTKTIAFKAGPFLATPGHAWESQIWAEFYKPIAAQSRPISWPHDENSADRLTEFQWREFLTVPKGDPTGSEIAKKLADTLQKKPNAIVEELNIIIADAQSSDRPNPGLLTSGVMDVLARRLVKKGVLNLSDAMHAALNDKKKKGFVTNTAGDILFPLFRDLNAQKQITSRDIEKIKTAVATLSQRSKKLQGIAQRGDIGARFAGEGSYKKLLDKDTILGKGGAKFSTGGLQLYGRKKNYFVNHSLEQNNAFKEQPATIQQIVVSFENVLASIPMVGYRYPLLQHVGSMDARVSILINARNKAAGEINSMYDSIETMALRYKQIPAGFTNLYIRNDFLGLFGLSEFVTEQITTETLPAQPGRSIVSLGLTLAGITSSTRVQDPEDLQEERVTGDVGVFKVAWKIINNNLAPTGAGAGKITPVVPPDSTAYKIASEVLFPGFGSSVRLVLRGPKQGFGSRRNKPIEAEYYMRKVSKTTGAKRSAAYYSVVAEAREAYNEFVNQIHSRIWKNDSTDGNKYYHALLQLKEETKGWGYVPGINQIVKDVNARASAYRADGSSRTSLRSAGAKQDKQALKQQIAALRIASKIKGKKYVDNGDSRGMTRGPALTPFASGQVGHLKDTLNQQQQRITELGLNKYLLKMRKIFAKVTGELRTLDEFKDVSEIVHSKGLGKGLMAYPDFKSQLSSVAGHYEGKTSNGILMKYEPDCYFWDPVTNGGASSPLNGIIDDYTLVEAKRYSLEIWKNAQQSVDGFFKTKYLDALRDPTHLGPYDVLTKDFSGTELAKPFYENTDIVNATRGEGVSISKSVVCDPNAKFPVNWYPSDASERVIKSDQMQLHTTNMNQLWTGVSQSAGGAGQGGSPGPTSGQVTQAPAGGKTPAAGPAQQNVPALPATSGALAKKNKWPKLNELRTEVQPLFESLLDQLKALGYYPKIKEAYRSGRRQKQLAETTEYAGKGKNAGRAGAHTWGLAADIINNVKGYAYSPNPANAKFFLAMRKIANSLGLVGVSRIAKKGQHGYGFAKFGVVWDPAHIQVPWNQTQKGWKRDVMKEHGSNRVPNAQSRRYRPKAKQRTDAYKKEQLNTNVTSTLSSPMRESIRAFEDDLLNGQAQSMMRAYPTFKLYFIEDDSNARRRLAFDDFFSYGAVQSIRVVRSRKIAADYCELMLTNISGVLSNRKFRQDRKGQDQPHAPSGQVTTEAKSAMKADTRQENPIASLLLQEGIDIHLRMGYTSDPDRLAVVFNGTIVEVQFSETEDLVRVVAQSHAIELVQDIKGIEKPKTKSSFHSFGWDFWGFSNDASTGRILEEMLAEPEVLHFGRWTPFGAGGGFGGTAARDLLTQRWTWNPRPADDNIFAPGPKQDMKQLGTKGISHTGFFTFFEKMQYIIYRTTIWDIFQEMTLRHPNFITSPVPYSDKGSERMTMFFGLPNQLYFARHPTADEERKDAKLTRLQDKVIANVMDNASRQFQKKSLFGKVPGAISWFGTVLAPSVSTKLAKPLADYTVSTAIRHSPAGKVIQNVVSNFYRQARLEAAKQAGYIKPFRQYHLVTSSNHIISNNIRASKRDVANTIVIKYGKEVKIQKASGDKIDGVSIKGEEQEFTLKLDCALPTEEIRTQMGQFINVTNEELAKRYALGLLIRNLKDIYKGELIIVGNPSIKPYDVCYIFDEYTDMIGAVEVEEVQHVFDQHHGFRTEIKPDMLVQAAEWSLMSTNEAAGVVMEGALRNVFGTTGASIGKQVTKGLVGGRDSGLAGAAASILSFGTGLTTLGGFLGKKIVNYTQLAHPVVMSPLKHHGRIFAGGVPTRKIPTSVWDTMFGKWDSAIDIGYEDWTEDWWDSISGWTRDKVGANSVGSFFHNGGETLE